MIDSLLKFLINEVNYKFNNRQSIFSLSAELAQSLIG